MKDAKEKGRMKNELDKHAETALNISIRQNLSPGAVAMLTDQIREALESAYREGQRWAYEDATKKIAQHLARRNP